MSNRWRKKVDDSLNYVFDFAALENGSGDFNWLDRISSPAVTISSATVTVEAGITKVSDSITDNSTTVTVKLSGGTPGQVYDIECEIVDSDGQTKEVTATIRII